MSIDIAVLKRWIGREQEFMDIIADQPVYALAATLNREIPIPKVGDPIARGAHWLFFQEIFRAQDLGPDGHPKRGGFMPPVPLPRRLWAGGRLRFIKNLKIGDLVTRKSVIRDVKKVDTRFGDMVLVTLRHEIGDEHGVGVWEEQDIAYLEKLDRWATPPESHPRPAMPVWAKTQGVDPVMLFRYSALTFNSHRVHYDYKYATEEEAYPGLLVHAPLVATILMDFAEKQSEKKLKAFTYRARAPLYDIAPFELEGLPSEDGNSARVWAIDDDGGMAMEAEADFEGAQGAAMVQNNHKVAGAEEDYAQHVDMSMEPTIKATWEDGGGSVDDIEIPSGDD